MPRTEVTKTLEPEPQRHIRFVLNTYKKLSVEMSVTASTQVNHGRLRMLLGNCLSSTTTPRVHGLSLLMVICVFLTSSLPTTPIASKHLNVSVLQAFVTRTQTYPQNKNTITAQSSTCRRKTMVHVCFSCIAAGCLHSSRYNKTKNRQDKAFSRSRHQL